VIASLPDNWNQVIFEYWDVPEENWNAWMDYYVKYVVAPLRTCTGHSGTCLILEPSMPWRADPHKVIFPHPQMVIKPVQEIISDNPRSPVMAIRTNISIDLHALLQHEWTHAVIHFMDDTNMNLHWDWIAKWEQLRPNWRTEVPEATDPADAISREFFTLVNNHWDVTFKTTGAFSDITDEAAAGSTA
jgi:hypothetical protein